MNKLTLAGSFSFAALLFLSACGSSGSSTGSGSTSTRTISGTLTGDLSNISGVRAVRTSDGAIYKGTTTSSARSTALTGTSAGFQVAVPIDNSYTLDLVGPDDTSVASVQFDTSATGASATTQIPVTGGASTSIDLGVIKIPTGTGATTGGGATTVTPSTNPLTEVDSDSDGINDFEDNDDDNDGISDDNESHGAEGDSTDSSGSSDSSSSDSSNGSDSSSDSSGSSDSSSGDHSGDSGSSGDHSGDSGSSDDGSSDS